MAIIFKPAKYGIYLEATEFRRLIGLDFKAYEHRKPAGWEGAWTFDELLLHPHTAIAFCNHVRESHQGQWFTLSDSIILRAGLNHRKEMKRKGYSL